MFVFLPPPSAPTNHPDLLFLLALRRWKSSMVSQNLLHPPEPPDPPDSTQPQSPFYLFGSFNTATPMSTRALPSPDSIGSVIRRMKLSPSAMAVNYFSDESSDEIYSGAFLQPIRARCAFVPLWRCLLTSSSNLPAPVKPSVAIACFFCSRSFQCTDLKFHRLLPSSSALCPMNSVPKGMTSSALLWHERSIGSDSRRSYLAHKDECSFSQSLLDFTDQRLDVGSVKSPWLHHGNAGVRIFYLNSILALSESIDKPISLSYVNVKSSEVHIVLFGAISGVNSKYPSKAHHQRHTSTSANIKPSFLLGWSFFKLVDCSPLALFLSKKASQTSSCRGHERSLSIFLLFVGLKSSIKTPLCVRPINSTFMEKFIQTSSRQGQERSFSSSSFSKDIIISPQSLFIRGDPHPVFKMWINNDAATSPSHSTTATASVVASPLFAETLAMKNSMTSAHSCGLNTLSLEALVKKLPIFVYDSNRLTYPFIALVFFNVSSEFHSMALNSLFVIFS